MAEIISFAQTAVSIAVTDISTLWSYLKLTSATTTTTMTTTTPRTMPVNGLTLNSGGNSFHFTFPVPCKSSVYFIKAKLYDLHKEWAGFEYVKEVSDIEIWRIPRIEGGIILGLDKELRGIFSMSAAPAARHLEAFAELVLEGVRMEDDEMVGEEDEEGIDTIIIIPRRELYDLFYDPRPQWLLHAHSEDDLDDLTAYRYRHFNIRSLKNILHLALKTPTPTRVNIIITHWDAADKKHFRTLLIEYPQHRTASWGKIILKLPLSKSGRILLACNIASLRFVRRYASARAPKIYGYALDSDNPLETAYGLIEGLFGTGLQKALLHLPLPEQAIGSLYQTGPRTWYIGPIIQKSLLEPPGTWAGLGLHKSERGPWRSIEAYYLSLLRTFTRWSKISCKLHGIVERSEDIEALTQLLPVLLGKIDRRFWKLKICFPYTSNSEGFVVIRPLFHNSVFDLDDDSLYEIIEGNPLWMEARINTYCILFRRLFGHLEADCTPPERMRRLGRDLVSIQRDWKSWYFDVDNFCWRNETEMSAAWDRGERDGIEELMGIGWLDGEEKEYTERRNGGGDLQPVRDDVLQAEIIHDENFRLEARTKNPNS